MKKITISLCIIAIMFALCSCNSLGSKTSDKEKIADTTELLISPELAVKYAKQRSEFYLQQNYGAPNIGMVDYGTSTYKRDDETQEYTIVLKGTFYKVDEYGDYNFNWKYMFDMTLIVPYDATTAFSAKIDQKNVTFK